MVKYESALAHVNTAISSENWTVNEADNTGFVVLRGKSDNPDFVTALEKITECTLPKPLHNSQNTRGDTLLWISPDEFLYILPLDKRDDFINHAKQAFDGLFAAVVDNSGGYIKLSLAGKCHLQVMQKVSPYNLTLSAFPVSRVLSTHVAKAPAIIYRQDDNNLQLLVRFSFADYVWRLLDHASQEYR